MKIRIKVFLTVLVVFGVLFYGVSKIFTNIETKNFAELEDNAIKEDLERIKIELDDQFDELALKVTDWSNWDDTYAFVEDKNKEYIDSNLDDETFSQLHLDFILIENLQNEVAFSKYLTENGVQSFPQDFLEKLKLQNFSTLNNSNGFIKVAGIIDTKEGPFVIAAQSITSSNGKAQPRGLLVFGYLLDKNFVQDIAKTTALKLDFATLGNIEQNSLFAVAQKKLNLESKMYVEENPGHDFISGFILTKDIFGQPVGIFKATMPRNIHLLGMQNTQRLNYFLICMGIVLILVTLGLFEFFVLRKISHLNEGVKEISIKGNQIERLVVEGRDEFADLDREINFMLDAIEEGKAEKKESEARFLNVADSAPVMIWVSDETNRIIYVNEALKNFLGKKEEELFGNAWTEVIHPEDKELVLKQYKEAAEKHAELNYQYRVINAKGEYKCILVKAVPRVTFKGVFKGYTGTALECEILQ